MTQLKPQAAATAAALVTATLFTGLTALPSNQAQAQQPRANAEERPEEIIVTSSMIPTPRRQIGTAVSVIEGADIELRGIEETDEHRQRASVTPLREALGGEERDVVVRVAQQFRQHRLIFELRIPA